MFERLDRDAREALSRARRLAEDAGDATVEAEHVLLALAHHPTGSTSKALNQLGMTEPAIRAGLERECSRALESVGVAQTGLLTATTPGGRARNARWGQSCKLALKRSLSEAVRRRDRKIEREHLLLGIVEAEEGVIPRLLDELAVSSTDVRAALGEAAA